MRKRDLLYLVALSLERLCDLLADMRLPNAWRAKHRTRQASKNVRKDTII